MTLPHPRIRPIIIRFALAAALVLLPSLARAQTDSARVTVVVRSPENFPAAGATVRAPTVRSRTDAGGRATLTLPAGPTVMVVTAEGARPDTLRLTLTAGADTTVEVALREVTVVLQGVVVQAARGETRVERQPERVEVLAAEDVDEKSLSHPGDLANLLVEMGGVRVQPTAPGLGGASIRLQGLPGRYSLLLVDGLPLYGAHAPPFSLVQQPPLDLRQVEVIKGAATALYGPGALGGVVDLISRPADGKAQIQANASTRGGGDALLWAADNLSPRWNYTLVGGIHGQRRTDVEGDGWADLAGFRRAEVRPRLFWTGPDGSTLLLTVGGMVEDRTGGTMPGRAAPDGQPFADALNTRHVDAGAVGRFGIGDRTTLGFRASAAETGHERTFGASREHDRVATLFGETTLDFVGGATRAVLGAAIERNSLLERPFDAFDFAWTTASVFAQGAWTPITLLTLEASARIDHHSRYGSFASPRLSALLRLAGDWTVRASGGRGFFAPTPLTDEVEEVGFSHLDPNLNLGAERGWSTSLDVGGSVGPVQLSGTAFVVRVEHPVLALPLAGDAGRFSLVNAAGPIRTTGTEAFAVYAQEPLLVTATWTHTVATELSPEVGRRVDVPLTPRNAGGVDVAWEEDEPGESGLRVALEVFYTGRQRVEDDPYCKFTPGYTTVDVLVSKQLGRAVVFAAGENLGAVRQTKWEPLLLPRPGIGGRWTTDEWAPLEGRVVRAGLRVSL